jgi:hypothetical protein
MAETKTVNLNVETNLGSLKSQLKTAQKEVETLSEKFGVTSKEATNAARKAAQLKDAIGDAKALTDAFNPDAKFNALSSSIGGVVSGFSAYQGALGLVGVESKELEATLLKVQSAMALSQGLQGLGEAKDSFIQLKAVIAQTAIGQKVLNVAQIAGTAIMKVLNTVMKANPVLLIVSGITALVGAFYLLTRSTDENAEAQKELNRQNELSIRLMKQSQKEIDNNISKLNNSSKNKIALAKAEGANSEQIFQLEKARLEEQIRYTKLMYDSGVKLTGEQYKQQKQAKFDLKILEAQHNTDLLNAQKDLNTKKTEENKASRKKNKEDKKAQDLEDKESRLKAQKEQFDKEDAQFKLHQEATYTEKDLEIAKLQEEYDAKFAIANGNAILELELEQAQKDALAAINQKYIDAETKAKEESVAAQAEIDKKKTDEEKASQDKKIQMTLTGLSILQDATTLFTAKNEKDARRQFKISKALSLSTAIINTGLAVTAALTAGGNPIKLATGMQFVEAGIAAAAGAINIAKISATQFGGFGGGGADKPTKPSDGGGGGNVIAPNFNIVGANGTNQLKQLQQAPVQAYVVSGEMSTQQSLDRNRLRNATL